MKKFRGHKSHHEFLIRAEPVENETRLSKWYKIFNFNDLLNIVSSWCEICPIIGTSYK